MCRDVRDDSCADRQPMPAEETLLAALAATGGAVLRNSDVMANLRRGGDVDILVPHLRAGLRALCGLLGSPRLVLRRSYVWSVCYDWGKVDLLPSLEWRGATYLEAAAVLERAHTDERGVRCVDPVDEAIVCWFASLLWGGFFKERYRRQVQDAAMSDPLVMTERLSPAVGRHWAARLVAAAAEERPESATGFVRQLRRSLQVRSAGRRPVAWLRGVARFVLGELALRCGAPQPILALPPDVSGEVLGAVVAAWPPSLGPASVAIRGGGIRGVPYLLRERAHGAMLVVSAPPPPVLRGPVVVVEDRAAPPGRRCRRSGARGLHIELGQSDAEGAAEAIRRALVAVMRPGRCDDR
jgi:hypothetical protein